jgi:Na+/H+ antiporter NhaD/arsenite permease-like protein
MAITIAIIAVFVIGYILIALEHPLHIDKTASALFTGVVTWAIFAVAASYGGYVIDWENTFNELGILFHQGEEPSHYVESLLGHFLIDISYILFFLLGAMTIVELIDMHDGFHLITSRINTSNKKKVLVLVAILTFFLSALLDNLTTSIVMVSLLRKIIDDKETRLYFAGMVILAANAGGAWSPIGDITTTMLWIGGQISVVPTIIDIIIPSIVCMVVPLFLLSRAKIMQGNFPSGSMETVYKTSSFERTFIFTLGVSSLVFVPIFKTVTHLPPYMGMLFGLSILWIATELMHKSKSMEEKSRYSVLRALTKIDTPSVLFFLGILSAVACLESIGVLHQLAHWLDTTVNNNTVVVLIIGVLSAIVDNVPLVAASMGMYPIDAAGAGTDFVQDGFFWQFVAYCAGTGGSMLIIGSAAGVAVMGIEKIDFIWYFKKFFLLAFAGYIAGAAVYLAMYAAGII